MNGELVKKAFKEAENSLRDKEIGEVKKIVEKTLEKLSSLKKDRDDIDKKIKILKLDIDDLKEGRLDRIEERQTKDPEAKGISVIIIEREKVIEREVQPWHIPYRWYWQEPYTPTTWLPYTNGGINGNSIQLLSQQGYYGASSYASGGTINSNIARYAACGTYNVGGNTVYLK